MRVMIHELRQGRIAFLIWTTAIAALLMTCVFLFPEMKDEMHTVGDVFASMGSFTAAFGMDRLNFGTLIGFYAIECGNVLGLGGALYASLMGITALSKEESEKTSAFLFSHPVSRIRIISEKWSALMIEILAMNGIIFALALLSMIMIGEAIPWKAVTLMHAAYVLLQIELAGICFGISACLRRNSAGIGLGMAGIMYVLNLMANMTERARMLKWISPFGYCEAADIVSDGTLNVPYIGVGLLLTALGLISAYIIYSKKDIY